MGVISGRLPESLHQLARDIAAQDRTSLSQFIASAVAEKVSALAALPSMAAALLLTKTPVALVLAVPTAIK
ncbi:hypothetical protein [Rhodoferax antarcticus]|uniref:Toxin-antitoxin system HicB family antitoxin n=1 Tax=Rhodoferax antarcticus ANT.BR TaxID=1111071 RepID=A0A1Q8YHH7_9BURK|nr:hypothetical protein [Rhodoferax antarcticus]APW45196.1 hypothetical protein RA876_01055 [Rhodoferax antarcticus]MCW2310944.1 hypothetical protein [Rhodoferax antarcticus]OLP07452.1 hypothetical protein BLL52_1282 [Rhodoferax antarcticus ANT.BR]